jgi:hypothetical protein
MQNGNIKLLGRRISLFFGKNVLLAENRHPIQDNDFCLGRTICDHSRANQHFLIWAKRQFKGHCMY